MQAFRKSILLLSLTILFCSCLYPLALWTIGQLFFPFQANGSIIFNEKNAAIGSLLIAQNFTSDEYFKARPSAANYDASLSTSSTLAASNPALRERVVKQMTEMHLTANIPADMVTMSASGLDPHISFDNAMYQLDNVASAWARKTKRDVADVKKDIMDVLNENAFAPMHGFFGEKILNVLQVNMAMQKKILIKGLNYARTQPASEKFINQTKDIRYRKKRYDESRV